MLSDIIMNDDQSQAGTIIIVIYEDFQILLNRLFYLEVIQDEMKSQITELISDSQQKQVRIYILENEVISSKFIESIPRIMKSKLADPEFFSGNRLKLLDFLTKCQFKFLDQFSRFLDEKSKVIYIKILLEEDAFSWFQSYFIQAVNIDIYLSEIANFEAMSKSFIILYEDPNLEISSKNALRKLQQTQDMSQYIAQFERLTQYIK